MKPPLCQLCRKSNRTHPDEKFKLLRFKLTEEDAAINQRMKDERRVGHPRGAYWFCEEHAAQAKPLTGLYIDEALEMMRQPPGLWARIKAFFGR